MARASEPGADDAGRARIRALARRARRLTELLLQLDPSITLVLIEHDMDVALTRRRAGDDDARRPRDRRRHARRDPRQHSSSTSSTWAGITGAMSNVLLRVEDLRAHYASAEVLRGVTFSMGEGVPRDRRPQRHGQDRLCAPRSWASTPAREWLRPVRRAGVDREAVVQDCARRAGLCAARPAALSLAHSRRAPRDRRAHGRRRMERATRLRPLSAPGRAQAERRSRSSREASSRCSRLDGRCWAIRGS